MSRLVCGLVWEFASIVRAGTGSCAAWVRDCRGNSARWPFSGNAPHQLRAGAILAVREAESSCAQVSGLFCPGRCICLLLMLGCGTREALWLSEPCSLPFVRTRRIIKPGPRQSIQSDCAEARNRSDPESVHPGSRCVGQAAFDQIGHTLVRKNKVNQCYLPAWLQNSRKFSRHLIPIRPGLHFMEDEV